MENLNNTVDAWETFAKKAPIYLETEYPYKNKKAYLHALNDFLIPKFFCLDFENKKVSYLHCGIVKDCSNPISKLKFLISKNRSSSMTIGQLSSLITGNKQIAVIETAKKRRNQDGTYKGIDKMHETKIKNNIYQKVVNGIAISRRMPDGSYRGSPKKTWSVEKVLKLLKSRNLNYKYLETETKGNKEKVNFICDKGHSFKMKINGIQSSRYRCPKCNESKDEAICREIIEKITGFKFPSIKPNWLQNNKTKRKLELDGYCKELNMAFEYDGILHYEPIFGIKQLKNNIKRDLIKDQICKENGVHLIRISYKIKNKEKYIKSKLQKIWQK